MDNLDTLRAEPSLGLILGGAVPLTGTVPGPVVCAALSVVYLGSTFITAFFSVAPMDNAPSASREVSRS